MTDDCPWMTVVRREASRLRHLFNDSTQPLLPALTQPLPRGEA